MGLAVAGITMGVLGTGVSVYGQIQQSKSAAAIANFNAQQQRNNAFLARREAEAAASSQRKSTQKRLGAMRAVQGARGVVGVGSALESLVEEAQTGELEALEIERQGKLAAQGFEARAQIAQLEARSKRRALPFQLGATALSGADRMFTSIANLD